MSQSGALSNTPGSGGPGIETLTGNSGGAVGPDGAFNINVIGNNASGINVVGNPGINTLTVVGIQATPLQRGTDVQTTYTADAGTANISAMGVLNVFGGTGITTSAVGNTVTIAVSGSMVGETITGDLGGPLSPVAGNWNIFGLVTVAGSIPINTTGGGNTLSINVQRSQAIPATDASKIGLAAFDSSTFSVDPNGFVTLIGGPAIDALAGDTGTATGATITIFADVAATHCGSSVNFAASASQVLLNVTDANLSTIIGEGAGNALITGMFNNALGLNALQHLTSGAQNTAIGVGAGTTLTTGSSNILIGFSAGTGYGSSESSNILLNNIGTGAENNVLRIGSGTGVGSQQLSTAFISGINGNTIVSPNIVTIDPATDQLGVISGSSVGQTITGDSGGPLSPSSGNWNIFGLATSPGTTPVTTSGAASTLTVEVQTSQAIAATDATKIGLCNFDSAIFTVDGNGFVSLVGGGSAIEKVNLQTGTTPIVPSSGAITINGATVLAGTNPVRTDGTGANTMAVEVQISQAIAATDATKIGLCNFNSAEFTVDANGFVELVGNAAAIEKINLDTGTSPIVPSSGAITFNGAVVAAGTHPVRTDGTGANTMALQVQTSQALAATDATKIGLCNFDSSSFAVDANGFVTFTGGGGGITTLTGDSGSATGASVKIFANVASQNCGSSVKFVASAAQVLMSVTDSLFNTIIGLDAGNATLTGDHNVAVGYQSLTAITSGGLNTGCGYLTLNALLNGSDNTAIGVEAGQQLLHGNLNTFIGFGAGGAYTGSESNNIIINNDGTLGESNTLRIGNGTGAGPRELTTAFISGINGNTVSNTRLVTIDSSTDQLGTMAVPVGGMTWSDQSGTFTPATLNGYFITNTSTANLPGSPSEGDTIAFIVDTTNLLTIKANTGQKIRLGNTLGGSAGTAVNTLQGDSAELVYRSTGTTWFIRNSVGSWTLSP